MDRPVKERLVGATILVALIVLIVPELLSGPKPPAARRSSAGPPAPTRNVSVDLTTSKATPVPQSAEPAASAATSGAAAPDAATPVGDAPAASAGDRRSAHGLDAARASGALKAALESRAAGRPIRLQRRRRRMAGRSSWAAL